MPALEKECDKLFSIYIRTRDNWTCQFCFKRLEPPTNYIQCSHFWGRTHRATRFDENNCDTLCKRCHFNNEDNKQGYYREFKLKQLGEEKYLELEKKSKSICKRSKYDMLQLKKEILEKTNQLIYKQKGTIEFIIAK